MRRNEYEISSIFLSIAIASPSVIPTAAISKDLSTVENFPASEVLNRNKDDIEKGRKVSKKICIIEGSF